MTDLQPRCTIEACVSCNADGRFCGCWPDRCESGGCETCEHDCDFHRCKDCGSPDRDVPCVLIGISADDAPRECDGDFHKIRAAEEVAL